MNFFQDKKLSRWLGYIMALSIIISTLYISYSMVEKLKNEEEKKIETIANSLRILSNDITPETDSKIIEFLLNLSKENTTIPIIIIDKNDNLKDFKNIDSVRISNVKYQKNIIADMKTYYKPIELNFPFGKQYIFYKNSFLLTQLQYFPIILFLSIALFIWFTIWYFKTLKRTEQSFLWAGLAKETAHQIGTPLSSIMGWVEMLKMENIDKEPIVEIEKDIERLKNITDRFSKIGSIPELKSENIIEIIDNSIVYLQHRVPKSIVINFDKKEEILFVQTNVSLFSWVIENLVKNAIDAIKTKGNITISVSSIQQKIIIDITDNGQGVASKNKKRVFEPGYTTKKRGWGLGLSLVKRIIEEYHNGKVFVYKSELNKGTTFRIILQEHFSK